MRIDVQTHIFPREYLDFFEKHSAWAAISRQQGKFIMNFKGNQILAVDETQMDVRSLMSAMDLGRIDKAMISCPLPDPYLFAPGTEIEACRLVNDCIAEITWKYPERFWGLGFLPWTHGDAAMRELERIYSLGFKGVIQFPNCGEKDVDDASMDPIYGCCARLGLPVVMHPTIPNWADSIGSYGMPATMGFVIDTGFALIRLIKSGIMAKYPKLNVVMPHAGGILPYLDGRLGYTPVSQRNPAESSVCVTNVLKHGNIWYDMANPSLPVLEYLNTYVGAGKMMFATDFPYVETDVMDRLTDRLMLEEEEKEQINWKNANEVFNLGLN